MEVGYEWMALPTTVRPCAVDEEARTGIPAPTARQAGASTMVTLKDAAQQALEALTPFVRGNWTPSLAAQAAVAMDRLEAALAEQPAATATYTCGVCGVSMQMEQPAEQEPVAYIPIDALAQLRPPLLILRGVTLYGYAGEGTAAVYTAPQPKAEQEPYCYTYTENGEEYFAPPTAYVPDNAKPLYAAPQPAKPAEQEPAAWRVRRNDGQYELYFVKASAERAAECYIKRPQVEPLYTAPQSKAAKLVGLSDADLANCDTDEYETARYWERVLKNKNGITGETK